MSVRKHGLILFCVLFFCYTYVHQRLGWNQNSRLALLHALVRCKSINIDAYHDKTGDKAVHNGHYFSDKPPGIAILALPAFVISLAILNFIDIAPDSPQGWALCSWMTTVGSVGVLTRMVSQREALVGTLAVFLGATPFPYATMLFSHAAVIGLLCIALWAIIDDPFASRIRYKGQLRLSKGPNLLKECSTELRRKLIKRQVLAGLCCGLAISSECTAAIAATGVLLLGAIRSPKRALLASFGLVPPLLLIPGYNYLCFGNPFSFGYQHLALEQFSGMNEGLFGITFPPKLSSAYLLLFSPDRGLFFWTPFFLMALLGFKSLLERCPNVFLACAFVIVAHLVAVCGYYLPNGGWALGPRHLAPTVPFFTIAAVFALRSRFQLGVTLGYYSILLTGLATLIDAMPPPAPFASYITSLEIGDFAPNIGLSLGMSSFSSLFVLVLIAMILYFWACAQPETTKVRQLEI
jgi:hypothetical protein